MTGGSVFSEAPCKQSKSLGKIRTSFRLLYVTKIISDSYTFGIWNNDCQTNGNSSTGDSRFSEFFNQRQNIH